MSSSLHDDEAGKIDQSTLGYHDDLPRLPVHPVSDPESVYQPAFELPGDSTSAHHRGILDRLPCMIKNFLAKTGLQRSTMPAATDSTQGVRTPPTNNITGMLSGLAGHWTQFHQHWEWFPCPHAAAAPDANHMRILPLLLAHVPPDKTMMVLFWVSSTA